MAKKYSRNCDFRRWSSPTLLVITLSAAGCQPAGPATYPVSGSVTFDGEPVAEGYITFSPESGGAAPDAGPIEAGKYAFRAKPGPKRVEIQASHFVGPENPVMGLRPKEQYIPERYNVETTLRAEVTPDGENKFDYSLVGGDLESDVEQDSP